MEVPTWDMERDLFYEMKQAHQLCRECKDCDMIQGATPEVNVYDL